MKSNQNEFKSNWDKIQINHVLTQNWAIFHQISTKSWQNSKKIDEKWDKNKNNGFGFDGQNLIIKFNKMNQNEWNLIIKSHENQWNPDPNLSQIQKKIN